MLVESLTMRGVGLIFGIILQVVCEKFLRWYLGILCVCKRMEPLFYRRPLIVAVIASLPNLHGHLCKVAEL